MKAKTAVIPISSPWRATLLAAIKSTRQRLFLICPYVKDEVIAAIRETLQSRTHEQAHPLTVRVLTRALAEDLLNGSSDLSALSQLLRWPEQLAATSVELKAINNLHAKVWIFDDSLAIVGSGNATPSGLDANLEYGLAISDPQLISQIQQEWEGWWQQAEMVTEEQIAQMQEWLERERAALQPLLAQVEAQRKEIERRLGAGPRIGKRLSLIAKSKQTKQAHVEEEPIPYPGAPIQQDVFTLSASHLYQALNWVAPSADDEPQPLDLSEAYIKLACTVVSADEYMLRCVWADGKRFSQATITGRVNTVQPAWTLILNMRQMSVLQHLLTIQADSTSEQDEVAVYFSQARATGRLHIIRRYAENIVGEVNIAGALTSPPPSFPRLRPPLSGITVDHRQLAEIPLRIGQQLEPAPSRIQMSLEENEGRVDLRCTAGTLDRSTEISLYGIDTTLIGPSVRLNLDYQAFHHVITRVPNQIHTWQISIDRDAIGVQFMPGYGKGIWRSWRHHLWHREN